MAKSFPDELAEWVSKRKAKKPRQDKHVVAFLAVKSDVKAALDAGYSMKTIWEYMRETGRLEYRYETFTQHVKRYIKAPQAQPAPPSSAPTGKPQADQAGGQKAGEKGSSTTPPATQEKSRSPQIGGFTFDATPKKEDLL